MPESQTLLRDSAGGEEPVRAARRTSARTCRNPTCGRRSPPATWDSCIPSPPARPWMAPACASSPGRRLQWRCHYCHNPDTWTMTNGIPVTVDEGDRRTAQVPPRPEGHVRRIHAQRRRAADAGSLCREALHRARKRWESTPRSRPTATRRPTHRRGAGDDRLVLLDIKTWDPERHRRLTGMDIAPDTRVRAAARGATTADLGALRPGARA